MGAKLLRADGQTDRKTDGHESNSFFSQLSERAKNVHELEIIVAVLVCCWTPYKCPITLVLFDDVDVTI